MKSGRQRENIDIINEKFSTYLGENEKNMLFNKDAIVKRSDEVAEVVRDLLIKINFKTEVSSALMELLLFFI